MLLKAVTQRGMAAGPPSRRRAAGRLHVAQLTGAGLFVNYSCLLCETRWSLFKVPYYRIRRDYLPDLPVHVCI